MKVVYICGRYRGAGYFRVAENILAAREAAFSVFELGAAALCPHANTAFFDYVEGGKDMDAVWLGAGLEFVRRSDALFVVQKDGIVSSGMREEINLANELGKPVFSKLDHLKWWLEQGENV